MADDEGGGTAPRSDPGAAAEASAHGELYAEVLTIFDALPEVFDRDVCQSFGYVPDRPRLFRLFSQPQDEGCIAYEEHGTGRRPEIFRKRDRSESGDNRSIEALER